MITYHGEIVIDRPVSEVFDYATTFEKFPEWTDTHAVHRLDGGEVGIGTRLVIDMGSGPMRAEVEFDTTAWAIDSNWTFKTVSTGPIRWDGRFEFEALGPSETRVSSEGQVTLKGWRRLLEPIVRNELRKGEQGELEKLKGLIEKGS